MTVNERIKELGLTEKEAELYRIMESTHLVGFTPTKVDSQVFYDTIKAMRKIQYRKADVEVFSRVTHINNKKVLKLADYMGTEETELNA